MCRQPDATCDQKVQSDGEGEESHQQPPLVHRCVLCVELQLDDLRSRTTRGRELTKTGD